jgi:glutamyl-tRNA synthetase
MPEIATPTTPVRVRIAPSPTGDPHVGTAYIALFNKALALKTGGRFILRIEDTDRARYVAGSEQMIFDALRWLRLDYDEGPDKGGPCAPYRQSERSAIYARAVDDLIARRQAYRCFCTAERLEAMRKEQAAKKLPTGYDGLCRRLSDAEVAERTAAGTPSVVRLAVPREGETTFEDGLRGPITFGNREVDDQVLMKSDGLPTYHLANVVDDHEMRITHVIRAEEWISSTPKHVLLYKAFGWEAPRFLHMPLLRNADKTKISKRKNPTSLIWYRDEGFLPEALINFLGLMGYSMGGDREVFSFEEFVAEFDLARLKTTGPVFDLKKLEWLNGEWIRKLSLDAFVDKVLEYTKGKYAGREDLLRRVAPLIQERIKKLKEFPEYADLFFFGCPAYEAAELCGKLSPADVRTIVERGIVGFDSATGPDPGHTGFELDQLEKRAKELCPAQKTSDVLMVLRMAVTGKRVSPPLFETMQILGQGEVVARLRAALAKLSGLEKRASEDGRKPGMQES